MMVLPVRPSDVRIRWFFQCGFQTSESDGSLSAAFRRQNQMVLTVRPTSESDGSFSAAFRRQNLMVLSVRPSDVRI